MKNVGDIMVTFSKDSLGTHSLSRAIDVAITQWCQEHDIDYNTVDYTYNKEEK